MSEKFAAITDQEIIAIQSKLAYQELRIEELSVLVTEQQTLVRKLEEAVRVLAKDSRNANAKPVGPADQKPPHY